MKRDLTYILRDIGSMEQYLLKREIKYRRNFNRFYNNGPRNEDLWNNYGNILSYYNTYDEEVGIIPYMNILRSAVDTTVSKLSQNKTRLKLNPVNGTFNTTKIVRNAQVYFDQIYDKEKIHDKAVAAIADALIFDLGVVWINHTDKSVRRIAPWEFFFDAAEMNNGKLTRCMVMKKTYPLTALEDYIKTGSEYEALLLSNPQANVVYRIYYDLKNKKVYRFINQENVSIEKIDFDVPPFIWIYYKEPLKGAFGDSMIDIIYRIQKMIDDITFKITTAVELSPANTTYVPMGSDLKASNVAASKTGDVFEYKVSPQSGANPVIIATPPAIDQQYIQLLEMFEQKAYNLVGVSQLSAQAKKPSGLNSGVALDTLEDVESERHNVLVNNFIHFQEDIGSRFIDIMPEDDEILPKNIGRPNIKWGDIKKNRDLFIIQASAASVLSKDPKVKMEQVEKLVQMGVITADFVPSMLEMPDLEKAYSIVTAAYDFNEHIIERAIDEGPDENGEYSFYEVTDMNKLYSQILTTILRLDSNDEDVEVIQGLVNFAKQVKDKMDAIQASFQQPAPVQQEQVPPEAMGGAAVPPQVM